MVRGKKPEEKPKEGQTISIDVESFVRMRNSVIANLATLQESVQGVSSSYIAYTNAVLGDSGAGLDVESALSRLGANPLLRGLGSGVRAASPAKSATGVEVKPAKKKRAHDPNAPKRPLTPYFLYMQTARPIIANDLGPDVAKGAVSAEGVQRWNAMAAVDKQLWTAAYTDNLKLYNARVHSYKSGNVLAKDMTDEDALTYSEIHNIGIGPIEPTADGQLTSEALLDLPSNLDAHHDEEEEEQIPIPAPKSKSSKSKPKAKAGVASAAPIVPAAVGSSGGAIVPPGQRSTVTAAAEVEKDKSPDKKRKRTSTKTAGKRDEVVDSIEGEVVAEPVPRTSDKKKRAKKA